MWFRFWERSNWPIDLNFSWFHRFQIVFTSVWWSGVDYSEDYDFCLVLQIEKKNWNFNGNLAKIIFPMFFWLIESCYAAKICTPPVYPPRKKYNQMIGKTLEPNKNGCSFRSLFITKTGESTSANRFWFSSLFLLGLFLHQLKIWLLLLYSIPMINKLYSLSSSIYLNELAIQNV